MASSLDSDNSWVLTGSESLPVETLGPESRMDPEAEKASPLADGALANEEPALQSDSGSSQTGPPPAEEEEAKGTLSATAESPGLEDTVTQGEVEDSPLGSEPDTQDPEEQSPPASLPSSPKAVWLRPEGRCSSSDDDTDVDVEGLRRRRGREAGPAQPVTSLGVEEQAREEGTGLELGISLNTCLLGALVLLGLGILLLYGGLLDSESEEVDLLVFPGSGSDDAELPDAVREQQDGPSQQPQAEALPDGAPSLQSMAVLLDKLAKENQDIRLLQAQLQTQKEELQHLMREPKGLEAENAQLRGALQRGEAAQRALEAELQQLRARLQGLEAGCPRGPDGACLGRGPQPGDPGSTQHHRLESEAQALQRELEQQRRLLGTVRQELEQGLKRAGQGQLSLADLAELGHQLAQKLEGLQRGAPGHPEVRANASSSSGTWQQEPRTPGSPREEPRKRPERWEPREQGRRKSWGSEEGRRWQGPQEHPRKSGPPHSSERQGHPGWKAGSRDGGAPALWTELSRHKYRAPRGCSGVQDCARQEGLAPVQRQELASLLRAYLARLPWAGPLSQELPLSTAYFGEDGLFRHDRLHFHDFVDALEDSLEEAAVQQTGDDDQVDDFEDFIYRHFFGEKAQKRRSGKKDRPKHKHPWNPKEAGGWEEHSSRRRG